MTQQTDAKMLVRRYRPTIILHGGAGAIGRDSLPPDLYKQYHQSLTTKTMACRALLDHGAFALDMACHAVSLMEDDPLFNCGRGSVFTVTGEIEMEASLMVTSIVPGDPESGSIKRTGAVSGIRNTRHPIQLAKQVLINADAEEGRGPVRDMHCHLSGPNVEQWGWSRGIERKDDDWFWTKRRWDEHRRGLKDEDTTSSSDGEPPLPSQGTVGCVCFDSYGNMAVATSTGGLTNKSPGRVGDTPMAGAGFWAESWDAAGRPSSWGDCEMGYRQPPPPPYTRHSGLTSSHNRLEFFYSTLQSLSNCLPSRFRPTRPLPLQSTIIPCSSSGQPYTYPIQKRSALERPQPSRRAIAVSGTGNGDSFVRVGAARTVGAQCRFGDCSLRNAVTAMAGPGGELQRSAGDRWNATGEGQGGIIGIEFAGKEARSTADFNCGGMWRAYFETLDDGREVLRVRVWRDEEYDDKEEDEEGDVYVSRRIEDIPDMKVVV